MVLRSVAKIRNNFMAKQGQAIDLGNSGVRMTIAISAKDTNGQFSQVEAVMQAGKKFPALPHYHPFQEKG
jgi:hypothetical protein